MEENPELDENTTTGITDETVEELAVAEASDVTDIAAENLVNTDSDAEVDIDRDNSNDASNGSSATDDSFDVFHWANEIDEVKNNVSVELFLFNKNYTPFRVRYADSLAASVKALFMQEAAG